MKRASRSPLDGVCETLSLIRQKPRTNPEIQELMGAKWDTVNSWITTLEKHKHIRMKGVRKVPRGMSPYEYEAT